jgi:hypothetical protein
MGDRSVRPRQSGGGMMPGGRGMHGATQRVWEDVAPLLTAAGAVHPPTKNTGRRRLSRLCRRAPASARRWLCRSPWCWRRRRRLHAAAWWRRSRASTPARPPPWPWRPAGQPAWRQGPHAAGLWPAPTAAALSGDVVAGGSGVARSRVFRSCRCLSPPATLAELLLRGVASVLPPVLASERRVKTHHCPSRVALGSPMHSPDAHASSAWLSRTGQTPGPGHAVMLARMQRCSM